jgi:hypothetical protein
VNRPEEALQRAVVQLLAVYASRGLLAFAHCPNGGYRTPAEAGALRAMGAMPGVPDILVWLPEGRGIGIELKAGARPLSEAQAAWHGALAHLGHRVYVCRSVDEVEAALRAEGVAPVGRLLDAVGRPGGRPPPETAAGHSSPRKTPAGGIP